MLHKNDWNETQTVLLDFLKAFHTSKCTTPSGPLQVYGPFFPHLLTRSLFGQEMTLQMSERKLRFKVQTQKHGKSIRSPCHKKNKTWHFYGLLIFIFSVFSSQQGNRKRCLWKTTCGIPRIKAWRTYTVSLRVKPLYEQQGIRVLLCLTYTTERVFRLWCCTWYTDTCYWHCKGSLVHYFI